MSNSVSPATPKVVPLKVFADFVAASGPERARIVVDFDKQYSQPYSPVTDWWREMRNAAAKAVRDSDTSYLDDAILAANPKKQRLFTQAADGIRTWFGNDAPAHEGNVDAQHWSRSGIDVRVRPEFIVDISGSSTAVKLWFRSNPGLDAARRDTHLHLMGSVFPEFEVGVLEAQTGVLHVPTGYSPSLDTLLSDEAEAFAAILESLP